MWVSAILFHVFLAIFITSTLSSVALVKSVNDNIIIIIIIIRFVKCQNVKTSVALADRNSCD